MPFSDFIITETTGASKCLPLPNRAIKHPNNNAFVDFNGDCNADLFLETVDTTGNVYYEFWIKLNDGEGKYCLI